MLLHSAKLRFTELYLMLITIIIYETGFFIIPLMLFSHVYWPFEISSLFEQRIMTQTFIAKLQSTNRRP